MNNKMIFCLLALSFLFINHATATTVNMKEGEWEISVFIEPPSGARPPVDADSGKAPPLPDEPIPVRPVKRCYTKKDIQDVDKVIPKNPMQTGENCKLSESKYENSKLTFKLTCSGPYGSVSSGIVTYSGESFQGKITSEITDPRYGKASLAQKVSGKRIGNCAK